MESFVCPITGKPMRWESMNGRYQPAEPYSSSENPAGLNERIEAAGYNPRAFMEFDGAIPVLAYLVRGGERVAEVFPARDRGRFGGWQVKFYAAEKGYWFYTERPETAFESIEWLV